MDAVLLQLLVDSPSTPATQKSDSDSAQGVDVASTLTKTPVVSLVDTRSKNSGSALLNISIGAGSVAGNCLVLFFIGYGSTQIPQWSNFLTGGVSDNWVQLATATDSTNKIRYSIWACNNCRGGATTLSWDAVNNPNGGWVYFYQFTGNDQGTSPYGLVSTTGSLGTSVDSGSLGLASGYGAGGFAYNVNQSSMTGPSSPWSNTPMGSGLIVGNLIESTTTSRSYSASWGSSSYSGAGIVRVSNAASTSTTFVYDSDTASGTETSATTEVVVQKSDSDSCSGREKEVTLTGPAIPTVASETAWIGGSDPSYTITFDVAAGQYVALMGLTMYHVTSVTDDSGTGAWLKHATDNLDGVSIWLKQFTNAASNVTATFSKTTGSYTLFGKLLKFNNSDGQGSSAGGGPSTSATYTPTVFTNTEANSLLLGCVINRSGGGIDSLGLTTWSKASVSETHLAGGYRRTNVVAPQGMSMSSSAGSYNWYWAALEIIGKVVTTTFIYDYDNGFSAESGSVVSPVSDSESASGTDDALPIPFSDVDAGSGIDASALEVDVTDTDTASAVEVGTVDTGLAVTDTETATAIDEIGDQEREDAESATADDGPSARDETDVENVVGDDSLALLEKPDAESVIAVEVDSLFAEIFDADTAFAVEADYPIGIADTDTSSAAGADAVSFLDYTYRFCPPAIQGWRDPEHPLFRRIPHLVSIDVLKIDGTYRQIECPDDEQFAAATEIYLGGHDNVVHQATADALTAAGYGAYLTRF